MHIFENFVSEEEEKLVIKSLDSAEPKWQKLLNRRVQHYGYEFKYGTNNVDPDKSLGVMPDFLHFLQPRIEKIMSHFEVKEDVNKVGDACKKVTFKNEPQAKNVVSEFGYFDQMTANDYMPG